MKSISKKILKILAGIIISLIIVILVIYFSIQTEGFNRWALQFTLDKLNEDSKTSGVYINTDSIQGNILNGLLLKHGSIKINDDTLFSFKFIDLSYDIWGLLEHEIRIKNLKINSPVISLSKMKDSNDSTVWNFSKLFTSSKETDTTQSVFDWGVVVENLKIENGQMTVEGQLKDQTPEWRLQRQKMKEFDFNNLIVQNLELDFSGRYFPDYKNVELRNLSFNTNSDFNVKKFSMNTGINLKDTISELGSFELITDRSEIKIAKAKMTPFNPFDSTSYNNFNDKNLEADLNISQFNFADLKFFVPSVDMLDSTAGVILNANGKYGDLNVNNLQLTLPNSEINLTGNIKKLDDPANMYLDVEIKDTKIFPKDIKTIYKDNSVPDYSHIGTVYPEITYTGTFENFYSKFDIKTSAGNVSGNIDLDLPNEKYNGRIITSNFNPGKILKDNSLTGNINLVADFSGHGFNTRSMNTSLKYQMGRSNIAGYDIRYSGGNVSINGSNVNLNVKHGSSMGSLNVRGSVNISNIENPVYNLRGNVSNFNLAAITKSAGDQSNLNFSFNVNGRGISPENINGTYNISMLRSQFGSRQIPETQLGLSVKNSGEQKSINLISDFADFNAEGNFNIARVINVLKQNADLISGKISEKMLISEAPEISNSTDAENENFDLNYSLIVKDSAKTNSLLAPFNIVFNGSISGQIENGSNGLIANSLVNASGFTYEDTSIVLRNFSSEVHLLNSSDNLKINLITSADKILIDSLAFDSARVLFDLDNSQALLKAIAKQDSTKSANINSVFNFYNDSVVAIADTLLLTFNQYKVQNAGDWILKYDKENIDVRKMKLQSRGAVINVSGRYSFNSNSDITAEANGINIRDLKDALKPPDSTDTAQEKKGVEGSLKEFFVNYKGSPENPELKLRISGSDLKHENENIGALNIKADYKEENAVLDIDLQNSKNSGRLKIKGNLPYENPFTGDSLTQTNQDIPVTFNLKAENFNYRNFLELIPGIPQVGGIMNGELTATGAASAPELKGSLKITEGSYLLELTGMNYSFELNASTENSKLVLDKLMLYNEFDKPRHIDLFGTIDFAGMKINDIDLKASGDMILLDDEVDRNSLEVYGNLLGGIGNPPVTIKGNPEKLKISGQLIVSDATISSVPTGGSGYELTGDNFIYLHTSPDTNLVFQDTLILIPEDEYYKLDPFEKSKYKKDKNRNSVAEFLDIDLDIKTTKNIYASIDFKNLTRARLFGEIEADLNLKTVDKEFYAKGNVDVVGNSYFKFYKNFKLKDSKIIFDGPIDDPELDIQAVHTGTKVSEQYGNSTSTEVQVKLTVTGHVSNPVTKLSLIEDGSEITGVDAQSDAVSYLLFGRYKSELTSSERTSVATAIGTSFVSSYLSQALREIFPFLIDAEFNYTEGKVKDTDVQLLSEFGDATVSVGGKLFKEIKNFEFSVDYPLNNVFEMKLPEKLMIEFYREELDDSVGNTSETTTNTGLKIIYKIRF